MSFASILGGGPSGAQQVASLQIGTSRLPVVTSYLTWGDPVNDPASSLGSMTFDAVLSEEHELTAAVTDHPVEQGTNIVDNVRPMPDRLTLEVFVSNSPINSPDAVRAPLTLDLPQPGQGSFFAGGSSAILGGAVSAIAQAIGLGKPPNNTALVDQFFGDTDYVQNAYDQLNNLKNEATVVSAITPHATYTNMVLESVKMHRDPGVGTSARFTLEMREIIFVYSSTTAAPLPSKPNGAPTVSVGAKSTSQATGPMKSLPAAIFDKLGLGK